MDLNKTPLTQQITDATFAWLDGKGFKPVETEVRLCAGWCADLAGVLCPTQTELIALKLLARSPKWGTATYDAWYVKRKLALRIMTCLVEVKISRGDFLGDKKWSTSPSTDLAFLVTPANLISREEWPTGWGILDFKDGAVRMLRPPTPFNPTLEQQRDVILEIAVRRDHHTRHARLRELQREERSYANDRETLRRIDKLAKAVMSIASAKHPDVETCLSYWGLHKMSPVAIEMLRPIYGIAKPPIRIEGAA